MSEQQTDVWAMTASEASAALAGMAAKNSPPPDPNTPAGARAALAGKIGDQDFMSRIANGSPEAQREFSELVELTNKVDKVDALIDGTLPIDPGALNEGGVSPRNAQQSVAWLKEDGISDGSIRELLSGRTISAADYQAIENYWASLSGSSEFRDKLFSGDYEARKKLLAMSIIRVAYNREQTA